METKELPLYIYLEENDLIYKLGEHDMYYPIIYTDSAEKNCSKSIKARMKLEFMKNNQLILYVHLVTNGKLDKYIKEFVSQLNKKTDAIFSKMKVKDEMGRLMAEEMARDWLL